MRPKILRQYPWFLKEHHLKNNSEGIDFYLVVVENKDDNNPWNSNGTFTVYASMHLPQSTISYVLGECGFWYPVTIPIGERKGQIATFDSIEEAKRFEDYLINDYKFGLVPEEFKHIHYRHFNVMDGAFGIGYSLDYIPLPRKNGKENSQKYL